MAKARVRYILLESDRLCHPKMGDAMAYSSVPLFWRYSNKDTFSSNILGPLMKDQVQGSAILAEAEGWFLALTIFNADCGPFLRPWHSA